VTDVMAHDAPPPTDYQKERAVLILSGGISRCPWRVNAYSHPIHDPDWMACRAQELAEHAILITNIGETEDADDE
jgi:hypothetical protein